MATTEALLGSTIAAYRIEAVIGRGGMGAVYRAADEQLGRKIALKVIAPELARDDTFRTRFLRESRIAASLDHPHVIPIYQAGEERDVLFLAMRYVEGTDLAKLIAEEGPLGPRRALDILSQVAEALDAAHEKGLVHRDVKPSNVLIAEAGGREHAYLADFACRTASAQSPGGSPAWSSPSSTSRSALCLARRLRETAAASSGPIDGRVEYGESRGRETLVGVTAPGDARFVVTIDGLVQAEPGSSIRFGLRPVWLYVFDASDQHALGRV
jgi:serine/threonine protein kinase